MNKDIIKGKWLQIKGRVKQKWAKLTDDDLRAIEAHLTWLLVVCRNVMATARKKRSAPGLTSAPGAVLTSRRPLTRAMAPEAAAAV